MKKVPLNTVLKDGVICLKALSSQKIDAEDLAKMANDYSIAKWIGHRFPNPYTKKDAIAFLKNVKQDWESGEEYVFGIFIKDKYIGNIGISTDNENNIVKNLGYWVGKEFEGNGYTSRAVELLSKFCFRKLFVRKIEAGVYEGNLASMKILLKNEFVIEGTKKQNYLLKNGQALDQILFGKLNKKMIDK